tara:strand:- start:338 stop:1114 length:777 start_codon:yes stop_codon:yes gene_type:complete
MGIISLNDKYVNDADSEYKTTGKEVRYRTSAKLTATTYTPKITGHYHYFTDGSTGGFGAFWESTTGELIDLIFKSTETVTFESTERTSTVQTASGDAWNDFEIDLTGKPNGRLVFYVRRNAIRHDFALDDIVFQPSFGSSVSFDPSVQATRDNDLWFRTASDNTGLSSRTAAKNLYLDDNGTPLVFTDAMGSNSDNDTLRWNYKTGSTGTSNTGPDNAADNNNSTFYMYYEASGSDSSNRGGFCRWQHFYNIETGAQL